MWDIETASVPKPSKWWFIFLWKSLLTSFYFKLKKQRKQTWNLSETLTLHACVCNRGFKVSCLFLNLLCSQYQWFCASVCVSSYTRQLYFLFYETLKLALPTPTPSFLLWSPNGPVPHAEHHTDSCVELIHCVPCSEEQTGNHFQGNFRINLSIA